MEYCRLGKVIEELREESLSSGYSLTYTVRGDSMRYLIGQQDEVVVRKIDLNDLRCGDIVVWNLRQSPLDHPVIHRIIRRKQVGKDMKYLTKGDNNPHPDPQWISLNDIIGKVTAIKRGGREIRIDHDTGRLRSLFFCSLSALVLYAAKAVIAAKRSIMVLLPEKAPVCKAEGLLHASSIGTSTEEWLANIDREIRAAGGGDDTTVRILDLGPGGFSEEALGLLRKEMEVLNYNPFGSDAMHSSGSFSHVLVMRLINLFPSKDMRLPIYRHAYERLVPGGKLMLSWINPGRKSVGAFIPIKRRFWRMFLGKAYKGPSAYDLVIDGKFLRCSLPAETVRKEIAEIGGFSILSCQQKCNSVHIAAMRI